MCDVIFKYSLEITDEQTLLLPRGSAILSVAEQNGRIVLYAHVDREAAVNGFLEQNDSGQSRSLCDETYTVYIVGTGHPARLPEVTRFLGTVNTMGGRLMWHVFVHGPEVHREENA